jgi:YesN/AraC family two-component response regulator
MKGIRHGACDYFIKPVRLEELRNIWQHVARKFLNESKEHDNSGSIEDDDRNKCRNDDNNNISSAAGATKGIVKEQKKRSSLKDEEDVELENDDLSTSKKPRVVWSVELHQQFVTAVNQLGLDSKNFQLFFFLFLLLLHSMTRLFFIAIIIKHFNHLLLISCFSSLCFRGCAKENT